VRAHSPSFAGLQRPCLTLPHSSGAWPMCTASKALAFTASIIPRTSSKYCFSSSGTQLMSPRLSLGTCTSHATLYLPILLHLPPKAPLLQGQERELQERGMHGQQQLPLRVLQQGPRGVHGQQQLPLRVLQQGPRGVHGQQQLPLRVLQQGPRGVHEGQQGMHRALQQGLLQLWNYSGGCCSRGRCSKLCRER